MREVVNAIFYVLRAGCSWRMMPHDLPACLTVYSYFRRWERKGVWQKIHRVLRSLTAGGYAIAIASDGRKRYSPDAAGALVNAVFLKMT